MKTQGTFQGWANRSTWQLALHLYNTQSLYTLFMRCTDLGDLIFLGETVFRDGLDCIDLEEVNYQEILDSRFE